MRNSFASYFRHWLLSSAICLVTVGWIVHRGWQELHHSVQIQPRVTAPRPDESFADPALANDPAIQATKLKAVGPLAKVVEQSSALEAPEQSPASMQAAQAPAAPGRSPAGDFDRVSNVTYAPVSVCNGRYAVAGIRAFAFQVPPHASFPRLKGHTKLGSHSGGGDFEVLILEKQQYPEFVRGTLESALFQAKSDGDIDFRLNATSSEPHDYYLVFHNLNRGALSVEARFAVVFSSSMD